MTTTHRTLTVGLTERSTKQLEELKSHYQESASAIVRRAIETQHEKQKKDCQNAN